MLCGAQKRHNWGHVKYWGIIADNLHKAGWSLGWVLALDLEGRTIRIVDAHGYGKRFVVSGIGKGDLLLCGGFNFVSLQMRWGRLLGGPPGEADGETTRSWHVG
jgi:hypothetical protein